MSQKDPRFQNPSVYPIFENSESVLIAEPLTKDFTSWCLAHRTKIEGNTREFILPMWRKICDDTIGFKMLVGGRQIYKSTYFGDRLAFYATTKPHSTGIYVTRDDLSLQAFSYDKFRQAVKGSTIGQVHRVAFRLGSKTYLVTDEGGFKHVEGKSPDLLILDEGQALEFEHWAKMRESMATTQGIVEIGGIGGAEGSQYHKFWQSTNQCEWVPKYEYWRDKLEYNNEGLVVDEYLLDVCDGQWRPRVPENFRRHGYWLPQTIFPHIPLTIFDAEDKYHIDVEYSIEFKQANFPQTDYLNHVMGQFYESTAIPVTEAMAYACMRPYNNLALLTSVEVQAIKSTFGNDVNVFLGVDYGSGNIGASSTIISIWIKWKARPDKGMHTPRYQLVYITKDPTSDDDRKAELIINLMNQYHVDFGVGDMGYGEHINKKIRRGGVSSIDGQPFQGVGRKFKGAWTRRNLAQTQEKIQLEKDETGTKEPHILIDKTSSIQLFIDVLKRHVRHPIESVASMPWNPGEAHWNNSELKWDRSQLIIPFQIQREVDWLVKEFTKIQRKDIEDEDVESPDKRQAARLEFMHPPDAVMSVVYMLVADANYSGGGPVTMGVRRKYY
jgi:hypothetical protein